MKTRIEDRCNTDNRKKREKSSALAFNRSPKSLAPIRTTTNGVIAAIISGTGTVLCVAP